jgi:pyruvate formate lyase activating enzyme
LGRGQCAAFRTVKRSVFMYNQYKLYSRRRFLAGCGGILGAAALCPADVAGDISGANIASGLHAAEFWEPLADNRIRCRLCPRACIVADGQRGYCRTRENRGGKYYTVVYGLACARNNDPIEKKPFFHVYPGSRSYSIATVGCNLTCRFCQNWDIALAAPEDFRVEFCAPAEIARTASDAGCRTLAYTYNEPTVFYEYLRDCALAGRERGVESVIVSNGYIEAKPLEALLPLLRAVKIDLKAFSQNFYGRVCDGELQPVLETIKRLHGAGIWFEIVVLVIPTLNDQPDDIRRMMEWIVREVGPDTPVHFSRFHPTYKMRNIPHTPPAVLEECRAMAREQGCRFVYIGNMPGAPAQDTICPSCGKILIRRIGYHIAQNHLKSGCCDKCRQPIPGVW